jgi:putative FmdB family regulatory protein
MPLYSYRCPQCGERDSHLLNLSDADRIIQCPICNTPKERVFDASGQGFDFKGNWFSTKGKY